MHCLKNIINTIDWFLLLKGNERIKSLMANHSTSNLFLLLGSEVLSALLSSHMPFI